MSATIQVKYLKRLTGNCLKENHSFANFGFVFFNPDINASLMSFVWSMALFQTAVYLRPSRNEGNILVS